MPRPITTADVPLIVSASILSIYDAPMLPIVKVGDSPTTVKDGVTLYQALGSQPIIRLLTETKPSEYYKILWSPVGTTSIWIGSMDYEEPFDRLLRTFEVTLFGDAKVDAPPLPPALITLNEVVSLYRDGRLRCGLPVKDVASMAQRVDADTPLMAAMRMMCDNKIRRLFLKGKRGVFVSDRAILAFLFSPRGLKVARDSPGLWTDVKVSDVQTMNAIFVSPEASVEDVGKMCGAGHDVFMLSDGISLVSKWDLVMKPWKAGRLRLALGAGSRPPTSS